MTVRKSIRNEYWVALKLKNRKRPSLRIDVSATTALCVFQSAEYVVFKPRGQGLKVPFSSLPSVATLLSNLKHYRVKS